MSLNGTGLDRCCAVIFLTVSICMYYYKSVICELLFAELWSTHGEPKWALDNNDYMYVKLHVYTVAAIEHMLEILFLKFVATKWNATTIFSWERILFRSHELKKKTISSICPITATVCYHVIWLFNISNNLKLGRSFLSIQFNVLSMCTSEVKVFL